MRVKENNVAYTPKLLKLTFTLLLYYLLLVLPAFAAITTINFKTTVWMLNPNCCYFSGGIFLSYISIFIIFSPFSSLLFILYDICTSVRVDMYLCVWLCIYTILICIFPKGAFYAWKSNLRDFFPFTPFVLHVNCFSFFYFMFSIFFGVFIFKCGRCVGVCTYSVYVGLCEYVSLLLFLFVSKNFYDPVSLYVSKFIHFSIFFCHFYVACCYFCVCFLHFSILIVTTCMNMFEK